MLLLTLANSYQTLTKKKNGKLWRGLTARKVKKISRKITICCKTAVEKKKQINMSPPPYSNSKRVLGGDGVHTLA